MMMRKIIFASALFAIACSGLQAQVKNYMRAPAYPLITIDPYTSAWSTSDNLYDSEVKHWTGKPFPFTGAIRVDGKIFRFMGESDNGAFANPAFQEFADLQATRTIYTFNCGNKIILKVEFIAPLFMPDLELLSRPVNYIAFSVESTDETPHDVQIYFEAAPNWAVNTPDQQTVAQRNENDGIKSASVANKEQKILGRKGDNVRIDWGEMLLATTRNGAATAIGNPQEMRKAFAKDGVVKVSPSKGENLSVAIFENFGRVSKADSFIMLAYDDVYSIQYFGKNLRPYWNKKGEKTIYDAIYEASDEYRSLKASCEYFDQKLFKEAERAGGRKYAELCAAAYRQAISAHKLVQAPSGRLMFFSKENFSNGSIGTVDVTYPSLPIFLYYNPKLARALLNPIFEYSESGKWNKPFPAHDLGTYPIANGQTYPHDMPIEEAGNMLIATAAIVAAEGDYSYAREHWGTLSYWNDYLIENGLDPENQLCTDDFAGHLAHNANLSIKAIMAIASYAYMAEKMGLPEVAAQNFAKAREMAQQWNKMARVDDHYKLAFDNPASWSQKYNLVWDKILKLGIFPQEIVELEIPFYLKQQNVYGLPLDNRETYTKADWIIWTATLTSNNADFEKFIEPLHKFMNETVSRVPMSDWYFTDKPVYRGFVARSVVGGYFIKMLEQKMK